MSLPSVVSGTLPVVTTTLPNNAAVPLSGNPFVAAALQAARVGLPLDRIVPGGVTICDTTVHPQREATEFSANASTVVYEAAKLIGDTVKDMTGLGKSPKKLDPSQVHHGVKHVAKSRIIKDLANPRTREEGWEKKKASKFQQKEMNETGAYERIQTEERMPPAAREAYMSTREAVISAYASENPYIDAYLKKVQEVGEPDGKELNEAINQLELAIIANPELERRGVSPREFSILMTRHELETWKGTSEERDFLRASAYGQEKQYVVQTLIHRISQMRKAKRPKKEWKPIERYIARAIQVYDRLIEGKKLNSGDIKALRAVRMIAFPYDLNDWDAVIRARPAPGQLSVETALVRYREASQRLTEATNKYNKAIALEAAEMNAACEAASLKRDEVDFQFQLIRLRKELERLEEYLTRHGRTLSEDDRIYFEEKIKCYTKAYEDHKSYRQKMETGDDPRAREHARNAKEKNVLTQLVFGAQWALFDLYEKYEMKDEEGNKVRPSCVSFTFTNSMRAMAEAVEQLAFSGQGIRDYFKPIFAAFREIVDELGIRFPGTNLKIGGREIGDRQVIDALAAAVGTYSEGDVPSQTYIYGLGDKAHILMKAQPHPVAAAIMEAVGVLPQGYSLRDDVSLHSAFILCNHSGVPEFITNVRFVMWGIPLPQQAQSGLKNVPIYNDYVLWAALFIDRDEGSAVANRKLLQFEARKENVLSYPNGTRGVTAGRDLFTNYRERPSEVLAYRIVVDRYRSGQSKKVAAEWRKMVGRTGHDYVEVLEVQDGSKTVVEPTWNLDKDISKVARSNVLKTTGMNATRNKPTCVAFGLVQSAAGFPTEEEWKEASQHWSPERRQRWNFQVPRLAYVNTLQLNEAGSIAGMRRLASQMEVTDVPEEPEEQRRLQDEIDALSPEEQKEATQNLDGYLKKRMERLARAQAVFEAENPGLLTEREKVIAGIVSSGAWMELPHQEKKKQALPPLDDSERAALLAQARMSEVEAEKILGSAVEIKVDAKKEGKVEARRQASASKSLMTEGVLQGAAVAHHYDDQGVSADAVALDLDKVVWDHFFAVDKDGFLKLMDGEAMERLGGEPSDAEIKEHVNINPQWIAFIKGYRSVYGKAPIIYSSTPLDRLRKLAAQVGENPLLREFFEALFGVENLRDGKEAVRLLNEHTSGPNPRIITRERIVQQIKFLMEKFKTNGCSTEGMTEEEKIDVDAILRTNGDAHLKLRSIVPYRVLVDDRRQNCEEAMRHSQVKVFQPEPWSLPTGRLYVVSGHSEDIKARLGQGRSGQAIAVMRMMLEKETEGRHIFFPRGERPERIKGLRDQCATITYDRAWTHQQWSEPQHEVSGLVSDVRELIHAKAEEQSRDHYLARKALASVLRDYFGDPKDDYQFVVVGTMTKGKIEGALSLLDKDEKGEIKEASDYELIEAPIRAMQEADPRHTTALAYLARLRDRKYVGLQRDLAGKPEKKGLGKYIALATKVGGKLKTVLTRDLPAVGQALMTSILFNLKEAIEGEARGLRAIGNAIPFQDGRLSQDGWKLIGLARYLDPENTDRPDKPPLEVAEAFSILIERVVRRHALERLEAMLVDERLSADRRTELASIKGTLEKEILATAASIRKTFFAVATVFVGLSQVFEAGRDLVDHLGELFSEPVVAAIKELFRVEANKRIEAIKSHREDHSMDPNPLLEKSDPQTVGAYFLVGGLKTLVGERTAIGQFIDAAQMTLLEFGLDQWLPLAIQFGERVNMMGQNKEARDIARIWKLGQKVEGVLETEAEAIARQDVRTRAENALWISAVEMVDRKGTETEGKEAFERLAISLWTWVNPQDEKEKAELIEMIHYVHRAIFGDPEKGASIVAVMPVLDRVRGISAPSGEEALWRDIRHAVIDLPNTGEFDPVGWAEVQLSDRGRAEELERKAKTAMGIADRAGRAVYMIREVLGARQGLSPLDDDRARTLLGVRADSIDWRLAKPKRHSADPQNPGQQNPPMIAAG